jgi:hypothetical protein
MAYNAEYVNKAVASVGKIMSKGTREEIAIGLTVQAFHLPYKFFVPEYFRQTGRCPESMKCYLTENG